VSATTGSGGAGNEGTLSSVHTVTTGACCTNGYVDNDGDGYGSGSFGCYSSGTIVGTGGDCYDVNGGSGATSTFPGQTAYFTTANGAGSFDYNCNSVEDKQNSNIGLCQNYPCSGQCSGGNYSGTLYGSSSPNSGNCNYGSVSHSGAPLCADQQGTVASCGQWSATGTAATGWWHISSGCFGSSYKRAQSRMGCR